MSGIKKHAIKIIEDKKTPLIRPANYPEDTPGQGEKIIKVGRNKLLVINLMGRVFFKEDYEYPFKKLDEILEKYAKEKLAGIIIDFHAEATSEKVALGHYADGRVSAVLGTHTHVQTADEQILSQGTAFISDLGMTGPKDSVIGLDKDVIVQNYVSQIYRAADVPEKGTCQINGVYLTINPKTKKTLTIERIVT